MISFDIHVIDSIHTSSVSDKISLRPSRSLHCLTIHVIECCDSTSVIADVGTLLVSFTRDPDLNWCNLLLSHCLVVRQELLLS